VEGFFSNKGDGWCNFLFYCHLS